MADPTRASRFVDRLFAPTDVASLALFRIVFGLILVKEVHNYFSRGWIDAAFIRPDYHFTFYGFDWVQPWPGNGMYVLFLIVGVSALLFTLGAFYRVSTTVLFLSFTYWFLLDQARYLNHYYLTSILLLLLIFIPAHRAMSIDALLRPSKRCDDAPAWGLWLLRWQLVLVYFMAGIAKLHPDWFQGEPMRMWLAQREDYGLAGDWLPVGKLFTLEWVVFFFTWGGLVFDLLVGPALLWKRTRPYAFAGAVFFHVTNMYLWEIGIFPWFMLVATTLFFRPDWPRLVLNWPRGDQRGRPSVFRAAAGRWRTVIVGALAVHFTIHLLLPFRHHLYPGDVHWTEEGHRFAWRMKLRDKSSRVTITVENPDTGETKLVRLRGKLTRRQIRKMGTRPDMLLQYCHHLADEYREDGYENVIVKADCRVSLNGRPYEQIIDPEIDLARQPINLWPKPWILPLTTPLEEPDPPPLPPANSDPRVDDD